MEMTTRSPPDGSLEYDLPVIKSEMKLTTLTGIAKIGELEMLETYIIYRSWMGLTPEEKKKHRKRYQKTLEPRSLVYLSEVSPEIVPEIIRLQFPPEEYDWGEMDLVKTLEKMYFVYEPRYWQSFETYKFQYVSSGAPRPLFMGFIDWNIAKDKAVIEEKFQMIEDWLEDLDVPSEDAIATADRIRNLVRKKGAYINSETGKAMPKISLWVFFTHDQNPKKFTGDRFKALAKDKEVSVSSGGYESSDEEPILASEDPEVGRDIERIAKEIEKAVEKNIEESIEPWDKPEDIAKKRQQFSKKRQQAWKRVLFEKPAENYVFIGRNWSWPKTDPETQIIRLQGKMPIGRSRKRGAMISEKAKVRLINLRKVYEKGYLLPPLKRGVTVITSKEDLDEATEELQRYDRK